MIVLLVLLSWVFNSSDLCMPICLTDTISLNFTLIVFLILVVCLVLGDFGLFAFYLATY